MKLFEILGHLQIFFFLSLTAAEFYSFLSYYDTSILTIPVLKFEQVPFYYLVMYIISGC